MHLVLLIVAFVLALLGAFEDEIKSPVKIKWGWLALSIWILDGLVK